MKKRGIGANSALALAGDAASKASGIVAIALAARWLTIGQFAVLGASLAAATILTAALDGGLSVLIVRDGAADRSVRFATLRAGLITRLPLLALALVGAIAFGATRGLLGPSLLVVAVSAAGALTLILLAAFRAAQNLSIEAVQKTISGLLLPALIAIAIAVRPSATTVLAAFVVSQTLALPLAASRARRLHVDDVRRAVVDTLRATGPFALMTIATLVYYRSGTLLLAGLRPSADTAAFTIASNVAIGLLALPNAITTGLLPNLSAARSPADRLRTARCAMGWTVGLCLALVLATGVSAPYVLTLVFGHRYHGATTPLFIMLAADVLIAVSGVLGTLLIASRRIRPVVVQVVASLAVNLAAGAVLVPAFGAIGAAVATLVTELVAVAILLVSMRADLAELVTGARLEPGRDGGHPGAVRA